MTSSADVRIDYFSDVLCIWAYTAQIRVDELKRSFGSQLALHYHFVPLFGDTAHRIGEGWADRGGYEGFGRHVSEIAGRFDHAPVSANVWSACAPRTSCNAHLYLKAVQLLEEDGEIDAEGQADFDGRSLFEEANWRVRQAFFVDDRDIGAMDCLFDIGAGLDLTRASIQRRLDSGEAMSALCRDIELCREHGVEGSPTYLLNEGRQKLYGNVGYRIIEANVQEILHQPGNQASWC
ncbi:MAG: disulfide bond formation protein DsbA [Gammaproteobacteria bacterium]